ncbi:hypothetical protein AB0F91_41970 [Amycolatopsis sp. NPDC023774]|uniref:hypothetical protein n=1 Tax=Amycolatopsis sp. NPDC023774 TaxID=3155015 RepID=UPI0033F224EB
MTEHQLDQPDWHAKKYARLLLNHLPEREVVLDRLVAALRPGRWLLLEEGDTFSVGAIDEDTDHALAMRAWCDVLATVADVDFGRKLPRLVVSRGLTEIGVECELPYAEAVHSGRNGWRSRSTS